MKMQSQATPAARNEAGAGAGPCHKAPRPWLFRYFGEVKVSSPPTQPQGASIKRTDGEYSIYLIVDLK